jgi:hypothetical protein
MAVFFDSERNGPIDLARRSNQGHKDDHGNVDGHDIGAGEMKIFNFTEDPKATFDLVKNIGSIPSHISNLKAGYREVGEDDFLPLYPEGLDHFSVI